MTLRARIKVVGLFLTIENFSGNVTETKFVTNVLMTNKEFTPYTTSRILACIYIIMVAKKESHEVFWIKLEIEFAKNGKSFLGVNDLTEKPDFKCR